MSQPVDSAVSAVCTSIEQHRAAFLDDLAEWLRLPSVPAQPDHTPDVHRSADWLAATLMETGFPTTEVRQTPGAPAVFAEWPSGDPRASTALVHGHHDMQPAAREDGWGSEPFEWVVREGRPYARETAEDTEVTDDKGQVFFPTLDVRAHLATTGRSPRPPGGRPARRARKGVSAPSDDRHTPNEKAELDLLLNGAEPAAYLAGDLAANGRHAS